MRKLLLLSVMLSGMAGNIAYASGGESLYSRIGGQPVVAGVVDQMIEAVAHDPNVNQSFDKVNLKRLKEKLAEQICALSGGGCIYTGDEMKLVHKGLRINEREFFYLVEALREALDSHGVAQSEKNELLAILAPMKRLIVEK
ncbi:MAG: hypothetical protein B7Z35_03460 [Hydrogenophilales bacterium 12-61-10]|nr:MAG: hypothetical protein B7Z35_03460 [Hydrogenophilales bacterium 12-61-10]OYX28096.1 MAG: hypothetical protein B7Z03_12320 [Hydrogenophilales bacterium 32-62-9]